MEFIKNFFKHDNFIIGLSGIRKRREYIKMVLPEHYKQTKLTNFAQNYLLM